MSLTDVTISQLGTILGRLEDPLSKLSVTNNLDLSAGPK